MGIILLIPILGSMLVYIIRNDEKITNLYKEISILKREKRKMITTIRRIKGRKTYKRR